MGSTLRFLGSSSKASVIQPGCNRRQIVELSLHGFDHSDPFTVAQPEPQ
jgi:hypothetical protein